MSRENVELVRRGYQRLAEREPLDDWSWFFDEFAHDDIELHPTATYLYADPVYRGRDDWARFWRQFAEPWDYFSIEVDDVIDAGDDQVLALVRAVGRGKGSGVDLSLVEAHLWTVRDGKLATGRTFTDRAEALRAAGL